MFGQEIDKYDSLLKIYRSEIMDKFALEDLQEFNEILFSAHSCAIEGNSFSVNDTRALKEEGLGMIPVGKTLFEAFEILDHFKAYEFLMQQPDAFLTEELVKETHKRLTEHTLNYRYKDSAPGEYTNTDMGAGDTLFGDHEINISRIPQLLEATQKAILKADIHPVEIAAQFHKHFVFLHPFRDGNGRLARLLSNFILLKFNHPILIINNGDKDSYINALRQCRDTHNTKPMVEFFFNAAISRMQNEIEQKQSANNDLDFTKLFQP